MDENKENMHNQECNSFACRHPLMKYMFVSLLIFLGAFAAFYVVTDWHFKRMMDPAYQMRRMDKMIRSNVDYMGKMAERQVQKGERMMMKDESYVRLEKTDKNYKIIVDLRPFDDDEKNVEVTANGNMLTITAAGSSSRHGREKILKITQNYMFDDDINLANMTKVREGKDLIIYIPTEK